MGRKDRLFANELDAIHKQIMEFRWPDIDLSFLEEEKEVYSRREYYKGNPILEKTFAFALEIITYSEKLEKLRKFSIAQQLLKSGTSIGANAKEAQNSESRNDFVHKMKVAAKEADETEYWLLLCKHSPQFPDPEDLLTALDQIFRILNKIISTSKSRKS